VEPLGAPCELGGCGADACHPGGGFEMPGAASDEGFATFPSRDHVEGIFVVDFEGGYGSFDSVVDSFVRVFVARYGPEALETLEFRCEDELFRLLLTKARHKWSSTLKAEERNESGSDAEVEWGKLEDLL